MPGGWGIYHRLETAQAFLVVSPWGEETFSFSVLEFAQALSIYFHCVVVCFSKVGTIDLLFLRLVLDLFFVNSDIDPIFPSLDLYINIIL